MKIQKKKSGGGEGRVGGGGSGWGVRLGGQGGCERRREVIVKIPLKKSGRGGREDPVGSGQEWGQGGCEQRIEVFVKIRKKNRGGGGGGGIGSGGGVRVDLNKEFTFL